MVLTEEQVQRLRDAVTIARRIDSGAWECQPGDMKIILRALLDYSLLTVDLDA